MAHAQKTPNIRRFAQCSVTDTDAEPTTQGLRTVRNTRGPFARWDSPVGAFDPTQFHPSRRLSSTNVFFSKNPHVRCDMVNPTAPWVAGEHQTTTRAGGWGVGASSVAALPKPRRNPHKMVLFGARKKTGPQKLTAQPPHCTGSGSLVLRVESFSPVF